MSVNKLRFLNFLMEIKGVWWMPRLQRDDEGRDLAAISFGEVPNNL